MPSYKKYFVITFYFLVILFLPINLITCSGDESKNSLWGKAAKFVKAQSSEHYLTVEDPVFISMEGEHMPSAWVEYFFSVYSTRNWITEDDEYAEYSRGPVLPSGINLTQSIKNDTNKKPQLVVRADDKRKMIVVEGYDYPVKEIVFQDEWKFPDL